MGGSYPVVISGAVEGDVDEAVLRRLAEQVGAAIGPVHGKKGKQFLLRRVHGYNNAARFGPWVVLVDLDQDADCAPHLRLEVAPAFVHRHQESMKRPENRIAWRSVGVRHRAAKGVMHGVVIRDYSGV